MGHWNLALQLAVQIKRHDRAAQRAAMNGQHSICGIHKHAAAFLATIVCRIADGEVHA